MIAYVKHKDESMFEAIMNASMAASLDSTSPRGYTILCSKCLQPLSEDCCEGMPA